MERRHSPAKLSYRSVDLLTPEIYRKKVAKKPGGKSEVKVGGSYEVLVFSPLWPSKNIQKKVGGVEKVMCEEVGG